jgi:hypothetical protein
LAKFVLQSLAFDFSYQEGFYLVFHPGENMYDIPAFFQGVLKFNDVIHYIINWTSLVKIVSTTKVNTASTAERNRTIAVDSMSSFLLGQETLLIS